jgi:transposase-like protein
MWYIVSQKNGTSAQELQNRYEFGSYETAWNWLHKLRRAMVQADGDKLSGCIQTGIACTGGALVAIAAEQKGKEGVGRIRIQQILDTSVENLSNFVKTTITPGSRVITEDFSGYDALPSLGYERRILDPGELILPRGIASLLERWMRNIYRGTIKSSHLAYYLDEFTFRFNFEAERIRGKLFYRLVNKAMILGPVTGDELKASALGT